MLKRAFDLQNADFKNSANHFWLIYIMLDIQSFKYNEIKINHCFLENLTILILLFSF